MTRKRETVAERVKRQAAERRTKNERHCAGGCGESAGVDGRLPRGWRVVSRLDGVLHRVVVFCPACTEGATNAE